VLTVESIIIGQPDNHSDRWKETERV